MIFFGEDFLWNGIREFIAHYHGERNHQGLDNRLIAPIERFAAKTGTIHDDNGSAECSIITIEMRREGTEIPNPILGYYGVCDFTPRAQSHTSRGRAWKHSRQSFSSGRYRSEARRRSTRPWTWRESGRLHPSPPSTTGKTRWRCWSPHWPVAVRIKSPQILCFG